ncbi:lysophospholipid acyltransferase family protein [Telmatospirillum sp.]|uniref:lysophospholipid acyltransferase family protein n=1 Tax=Telmatospirillum sp. TaxID=2079197 RepID=UPI00283B1A15|nr:lysophospholipid acyltransferase family protein [Telmatospirillum sp.]MDR3435900.1 lysophospholipid acyltransferase family protein [Telmatospirillum sp.]
MGLVKAVTRAEAVRRFLCWLGAQYIRLVFATGRWDVRGADIPAAFWDGGRPFILAFWHGRILMMPYCWRREKPINMLISQHRDGQIIAQTVSHFGIDTVSGSSSKGGSAALRTMLKSLKAGQCIGITPDGPRGPRMRASDGIVQVARLSGCPIIPCSFSAGRRKILGSWDRFVVALPFSKGLFVWGAPIEVPSDSRADELLAIRGSVEASLNAITRQADQAMGHPSIEPAPLPDGTADEKAAP